MNISPPLKFHGGKYYLAHKLHALAKGVKHIMRVHAYAGGLGEFWNWPRPKSGVKQSGGR